MDVLLRVRAALNDVDPCAWREDLTEDDIRELVQRLQRAEATVRAIDLLAGEGLGLYATDADGGRTLAIRVGLTGGAAAPTGAGRTLPLALVDILAALDARNLSAVRSSVLEALRVEVAQLKP